jgi:hypothetical protein
MPKQLYMWDSRDNVRQFDGRFWNDHSVLPDFETSIQWGERCTQFFVYRGELFGIYPAEADSHTRISKWVQSTTSWSQILSYSIGSYHGVTIDNRSNFIRLGDNVVWIECCSGNGGDANYFFINRFRWNGSAYAHSRTQLRDFGALATASSLGNPESSQHSPTILTPWIWPWRDGILIGPRYGHGYSGASSNSVALWQAWGKFTPNTSHANWEGSMDWYRQVDGNTTNWKSVHSGFANSFTYSQMQQYAVCLCPWGEKIYYMNMMNEMWSYDPDTETHAFVFTQQDADEFQVNDGGTFTVASASSGSPLNYGGSATTHYTYPYAFGSRAKILDHGGAGIHKNVWYNTSQNAVNPGCVDSTNTALTEQSNGVQFKVAWGCGYTGNREWHCQTTPFVEMFIYDSKLYILQIYALKADSYGVRGVNAPYWTMTVWNGTDAPTRHQWQDMPSAFNRSMNYSVVLDESAGILHIVSAFGSTSESHHFAYDLTENEFSWLSYAATGSTSRVLHPDSLIAYDHGDVTPNVDSVAIDVPNGRITVTYTLSSISSETADIEVSYATQDLAFGSTDGEGWQVATRKGTQGDGLTSLTSSPSGVQHTFVHDLDTDMGGQDNHHISYQVRIVDQTRSI